MRAPSGGDNITFIRGQQAPASRKPTRIRLGCSEIWGWGRGDRGRVPGSHERGPWRLSTTLTPSAHVCPGSWW